MTTAESKRKEKIDNHKDRYIYFFISFFYLVDTKNERNSLMLKVYPELKKYCQSRGFDFQVVDMRWGVRREVSADHITSELCMKEIENCQKLSTGPNFIVSIPSSHFKILFIIFNLDQLIPCRYTEYI